MSEMNDELKLSTGKKVVFRPSKIADEQVATEKVSDDAASNKYKYTMALQMEILRMRLVSIDGKKPTALQLEDFDSMMTQKEFGEIIKYLEKDGGNVQMPQVSQVKGSGKE